MRGGKRPDGLPVSMVLTSQAHRRRPPKKNRRIPTIPAGCLDGRLVHVSAVDTGARRSESGALGGTAQRRRGVEPPPQLPPTLHRLPHPAPATRVPSHVTNVMTSNIELYLAPARRPAGHGSTPTPPAPSRFRPESPRVGLLPRGSGSTDHGLCILHEGPTHPQYPRPSSSRSQPSCIAPRRHQQPPEQLRAAGPAPPEKRAVAPTHGRPTPPVS